MSFVRCVSPQNVSAPKETGLRTSLVPSLLLDKATGAQSGGFVVRLRSHSKSMAVLGFEPGSFDSWFSAPSMLLPWSSGKSESDCRVTWMPMPLAKQGRQGPLMGLNYLPLSGAPVGPRQRTFQSWSVCLWEVFTRGGGEASSVMECLPAMC